MTRSQNRLQTGRAIRFGTIVGAELPAARLGRKIALAPVDTAYAVKLLRRPRAVTVSRDFVGEIKPQRTGRDDPLVGEISFRPRKNSSAKALSALTRSSLLPAVIKYRIGRSSIFRVPSNS